MHLSNRLVAFFALTLLFAPLLTSCGEQEGSEPEAETKRDEVTASEASTQEPTPVESVGVESVPRAAPTEVGFGSAKPIDGPAPEKPDLAAAYEVLVTRQASFLEGHPSNGAPSRSGLQATRFDPTAGGVTEVEFMLRPGSELDILGCFRETNLVPGRVVSATPFLRPQVTSTPVYYGGLRRPRFKLIARAVTYKKHDDGRIERALEPDIITTREVPAGTQDAQLEHIAKFVQDLQALGDDMSSFGFATRRVIAAYTFDRAYQSLKFSASYSGFSVDGEGHSERTSGKKHLFIFHRTDLFTVSAAPADDVVGSRVHNFLVEGDAENLRTLQAARKWRIGKGDIPYTDLPVHVDSVTFGRIAVAASEAAVFSEEQARSLNASYGSPTFSGSTAFRSELEKVMQQSRFAVVAWGGGEDLQGAEYGSAATALDLVDKMLKKDGKWSPTSPGRPIAIELATLDTEQRRVAEASLSSASVASRRPRDGATVAVVYNCSNDYDDYNHGEITLEVTYLGQRHHLGRDVDDPETIPLGEKPSVAVEFGVDFKVHVKETEDGGFLDGDDSFENDFVIPASKMSALPGDAAEFLTTTMLSVGEKVEACESLKRELSRFGFLAKEASTDDGLAAAYARREKLTQDLAESRRVADEQLKAADAAFRGVQLSMLDHKIEHTGQWGSDNSVTVTITPNVVPVIRAAKRQLASWRSVLAACQ